jgi:hypothetical protein
MLEGRDVPFAMISARSSLVPVRMTIRGALCELARPFLEGGFRDDYQLCARNAEKVFEVRKEQYCLEGLAKPLDEDITVLRRNRGSYQISSHLALNV